MKAFLLISIFITSCCFYRLQNFNRVFTFSKYLTHVPKTEK